MDRAYGISASPLEVTLDTGGSGRSVIEIWVKDVDSANFTIYGSFDGLDGTWREIETLKVPHAGKNERHEGFLNAYQYIKVVNDSETQSEIEVVAGEM